MEAVQRLQAAPPHSSPSSLGGAWGGRPGVEGTRHSPPSWKAVVGGMCTWPRLLWVTSYLSYQNAALEFFTLIKIKQGLPLAWEESALRGPRRGPGRSWTTQPDFCRCWRHSAAGNSAARRCRGSPLPAAWAQGCVGSRRVRVPSSLSPCAPPPQHTHFLPLFPQKLLCKNSCLLTHHKLPHGRARP